MSVTTVVEQFRTTLQHDGAGFELIGVTDGVARIRLVLSDETCADCILPKDALERTVLVAMGRDGDAQVTAVVVDDPRVKGAEA